MPAIAQQLLFAAVLGGFSLFIFRRIARLVANVKLGKDFVPEAIPTAERWKKVVLFGLGQRKMFDKPFVGAMHFVIYAGFFIINIEILEIILDGLLGTHRLFAPLLGNAYAFFIDFFEVLAFGVLAVCVVFLLRRNVAHIARFRSIDLANWPRRDANLILVAEIVLMGLFLSWNASETVLQGRGLEHYQPVGSFVISGSLLPIFDGWSTGSLLAYERFAWWAHIIGILSFAVYVTYSKHLHIGMAFPNIYWGRAQAQGQMANMPAINTEVRSMMGLPSLALAEATGVTGLPVAASKFGAQDVTDLTWKHLMDAYSCTECGRCTDACPANLTGKKLSPRAIMMKTRDRMEEIGREQDATKPAVINSNVLLDNYITRTELLACTSCNACVTACPVNINPLDIILELRRYAVMEESQAPASWNAMFQSTENNQAPWAYPPAERLKWLEAVE